MSRLFAAVAVLACGVALAAFVALAVGVWFAAAEAGRRADFLFGEALAAIDRAKPLTKAVRETVDAAHLELQDARPPAPADVPAVQKMILRSALKETPGRVAAASRAADGLGDLLVVAHAALTAVDDLPGADKKDLGDLEGLRQKVSAAAESLHKADGVLRAVGGKPDAAVAAEDVNKIEAALADARVAAVAVDDKLDGTRSRIAALRTQLPDWLAYATWAIAGLSVMGALGQVALIRRCLGSRRQAVAG